MHILVSILLLATIAESEPADVVVVCPAEFREAMQPWEGRRAAEGHVVRYLSNLSTPIEIREQIRSVAKDGKLRFVLLVGDAPPKAGDPAKGAVQTPTFRVPSKITKYWGNVEDYATDNPYADLDDDQVPELAIGRLTAHTADELSEMLKKILAYEDCQDFGPWRTRINFVAGEGGYGALVDGAIETMARKVISWGLPATYQPTLTNAVWRSSFCPDPHRFHARTLERMNEGCLFWVFMGHGSPRTLQSAVFPDGQTPILQCEDCGQLHCGAKPPIVLSMCCYTGALSGPQDCLAEELLRAPGGPVAVIAGSSETMPYGMAALARQAIHEYFDEHAQTLGQWLLVAKRDTMAGDELPIWSLVNAVTVSVAPEGVNLKAERLEHLQLFNLFGDPTMRLAHPREAKLTVPRTAAAGATITVRGECPVDGAVTVELVRPLDRLLGVNRDHYDGSTAGRTQFEVTYRKSNQAAMATAKSESRGGQFQAELPLPAGASGDCRIRAFVQGTSDFAAGAARLSISPAEASASLRGSGVE